MSRYSIIGLIALIVILFLIEPVGIPTSSVAQSPSVIDSGVTFPEPTSYVMDSAGVLTSAELLNLNAKVKTIDMGTGGEIAVAVIKTTGSLSIEEYGIRLGEKWKVGKEGKDNGVILIIATQDRKLRIEVGKGAEADITDAEAGDIIRDVIGPKLHTGNWYGGISDGIDAINARLQ